MSPSVEPFNKAKYKALMDGLEATEINIASIKSKSYDFRIESEYYRKKYIAVQNKLNDIGAIELKVGYDTFITDGTHYTPNYVEKGVPFLSAINVQENYLDIDCGYKYITPEQHADLCKRVHPHSGDVLLRKVGVGKRKACVVPETAFDFSIFVSVALLRSKINPYFLSTYINSTYGQLQLLRFNKGISQPDLHLEDISRLLVPKFSATFISHIECSVRLAINILKESRIVYGNASHVLDVMYSIKNISNNNSSVKPFSSSLNWSGRLDAEYYQPKYDEIIKRLNTNDSVASLCEIHDDNFFPEDDMNYQYIELANVGANGVISNVEKISGSELPTRARRIVKKGQIIISSIEGSLQSCAYITDEYDGALCSTGFYVITSKYINSETLLVLFKSDPIQALLKQHCSGTILTGISKDELLSIPLPKIDSDKQKEIAQLIQKSYALRRQSEQVLDYAVKAVEMAVEQGENVALAWLKDKVGQ